MRDNRGRVLPFRTLEPITNQAPKFPAPARLPRCSRLGRNGLEINKPSVRYTLENLDGEFSGLALLAYMHVGFRMFDAKGDAGTGLDREYDAAVKMRRER